jgi:peptide/nickel transport system permease protein
LANGGLAEAATAVPEGHHGHLFDAHPLLAYSLRRVAVGILLTFVISVLIFAATELLPGDAATAILGRAAANPVARRVLELQLGLNHSAAYQYTHWLGRLLEGNLGTSYAAQEPVTTLLGGRIGNTLILAGVTMLFMVPIALVLGTWAGVRRGRRVDSAISGFTLGAIALPEFVTGTILALIFAVVLKWLPAVSIIAGGGSPLLTPRILVLPVATLLIAGLAYTVRMVRAGVGDAMISEYAEAARLNGVPEGRVIRRHILRNALAPSVQVFAMTFQWLVGGVVVVETVFQYPGIGQALVQAVSTRDAPVVQALGMLIAFLYIFFNIAADLIVVMLIPKLRTEAR